MVPSEATTGPPNDALPEPRVNILLVDDRPSNLLALEAILHDLAQNLMSVTSGEEALRRLLAEDFAVILLDVQMQGMDGFETARLIRGRDRSRHTPIIFLTSMESPQFPLIEAYKLGAVDYLVRPLVPIILRAKVAGFVELFRKTERLRQLERREGERRLAEERQHWEVRRLQEEAAREKRLAEELAAMSRRKDEFLAVLGHELRNPLAPIRNALQVLHLRGTDPATLEWTQGILDRQVGQVTRLVDDLLDVSRIARGKIQLRRQRLDLATLVRHTAQDHAAALEDARLALTVTAPDEPVWVEGDPTRLTQVLGNLLHNAIKFTDPGGRVTVRLTVDRAARRAVVGVSDTGIGIAPDMLGRVFDTFAQADGSMSRSRGGLGLGLALVRGLVELHGGRVQAASAGPDSGAEITFWLPLAEAPAPASQPEASTPQERKQLRILIIEDNRDAAQSLRLLLELHGHKVTLAATGDAGVQAARQWRPDVVLCDLGLPGMDGYAVARALRADPGTAGPRLIAVSGYGHDEDRQRALDAGFDQHLTKPADPVELQRLLAEPQT
jgi:signal transduction histidine kinase